MAKRITKEPAQTKTSVFQIEYEKLTGVFAEVEEPKRRLVEGLITDAAFLFAENWELRKLISQTGSIKVHPQHPDIQKTIPAATQFLKNSNAYAVIIKALNGVLTKNMINEDDDMSEFE